MFSLGYFFQQKNLSLQVQETEAHGAFLKVIELMNSPRPFDQIEAVQLCGQICSRFASPTIVNSAFMRIAEAFKNGSNTLQTEVLKVIQRNAQCLKKIHNYAEFIRPIFTVMYSNDPIARAVTLRLLAAISVSIPDQLDVHHAIRMALQSDNRSELAAAVYASTSLAKISGTFAEAIAADVIVLLDKKDLSDDEKIGVLSIIPFIASSRIDSNYITCVIDRILELDKSGFQSSRLIETCLHTMSDLISRGSSESSIGDHLIRLKKWTRDDRPEVGSVAAKELVRFFRLSAVHISSHLALNFIKDMLESENQLHGLCGIKCATVFLNDSMADYGSFLTDGAFRMFISYGHDADQVVKAMTFALLCRIVALRNDEYSRSEQRQSVIVHAAKEKGRTLSELDQLFVGLLISLRVSAEAEDLSPAVVRIVLHGLRRRNTDSFPDLLVDACYQQVPHLVATSPSGNSLLDFLRFLQDLSTRNPTLAVELLNQNPLWHSSDLNESEKAYEIAVISTALQFAASDVSPTGSDQALMASQIVAKFQLTHWNCFCLARCALADGRHVFGAALLNHILEDGELSKSSQYYNWIQILRDLAQAETTNAVSTTDAVSTSSSDIHDSTVAFMDIQLKLGDFRKSNRCGTFKKMYLDIRLNLQLSLELLMNSLDRIRVRAADLGTDASVTSLVLSHLSSVLQKFQAIESDCSRLLSLMFDADGPSLNIVKLNRRISSDFGCVIAGLLGKPTISVVRTASNVSGINAALKPLEEILNRPVSMDSMAEAYGHLKTLYQAAKFLLNYSMPIPRYFMQQYQQTVLSVNITPAPTADKEFSVVINMETKLTLKIEGVLNVEPSSGSKLMRSASAVRIYVKRKLMKSLPFSSKALYSFDTSPENMTHVAFVKDLNFFAHIFVMTLGYPGIYRLSIDFELEDQSSTCWDAFQSAELFVKVTESHQGRR